MKKFLVSLALGLSVLTAGVTSFAVTVPTTDDTTKESTETLPLTIGGITANGAILDNDEIGRAHV